MTAETPTKMASEAASGAALDVWQSCLEQLALELPEQQYQTWIKPLSARFADDCSKVTIFVANRFKLDWVRLQYGSRFAALMERLLGQPVQIELALSARDGGAAGGVAGGSGGSQGTVEASPSSLSTHSSTRSHTSPSTNSFPVARDAAPSPFPFAAASLAPSITAASAASATSAPPKNRLNPALTFDALIEGSANRVARAAAMHVASMPGTMYNPLFIYGGVGLGKTHLMHAIGNRLLVEEHRAKILYIHAEQFVTDVVKAYQRKAFDEFKEFYHSLDLLLIDDVQFFANKDRTQEEFFNAFEALLAKKSHIVMTSDTYPKGLTDIHERLVSRFDSGLTVAIEPPELEMRVAILLNKAQAEGIPLSEEVAFFVAKNVRSNVRELEGALRKVLAYARFNLKEISIPTAKDALRDLLSIQNRQISVEYIQKTVADYYKIKVADMYSKKRPANIARPRQIAMYLSKELTQKSLPEIGEIFGGRDHTTVLHAVRKVSAERQTSAELNQQLHVLEQTLKG
ncbi:chromosomal replication initiator protein [Candidatus Symbiobacter mobilis CR]|uniref:Chromosomal replication initiator protein DnaA n=2 Tax=Candidatus Symbiobacter TaxID=1436289 RepID=U5N4F5_9BURK|nr:chromosomal replication initiator protein DnaA [Candidatus Symbiobacter mobilis]AGX86140.1 chromosomal replication initiator protein [Candidatus Symbiobacter mobilis CR]